MGGDEDWDFKHNWRMLSQAGYPGWLELGEKDTDVQRESVGLENGLGVRNEEKR